MFHILLHRFNFLDCLETKIMTTDINFISNNVKGIRNSLKRLKFFYYLKERKHVLFLQEIHTSSKDEIQWKDKFKGSSNSCGVAIDYTGKRSFQLLKKKNDENGHFLILEAMIDDCFHFD